MGCEASDPEHTHSWRRERTTVSPSCSGHTGHTCTSSPRSPGTYYLTKGWLESGSHPLKEYYEYLPKYGPETTLWLLDQQYANYERIALVASNTEELAAYREQAKEVARFCERWNMRYEEITGSDDYVSRLIKTAIGLRDGVLTPDAVHSDFLVIPPGEEIRQEMYMR